MAAGYRCCLGRGGGWVYVGGGDQVKGEAMADRDQAIALRVAPTLRLSRISEREPVARSGPTVKPTRPELEAVAATSPMPEQSGNLEIDF